MFDSDVRLTWKDDLDVLFVSDRVAGMLGYEQADLLSSISLQQLIHPRDLPLVHELFAPFAARRRGDVCLRIRGVDGRIRCLRFSYVREWPVRDKIVVRARLSDGRRTAGLPEPSAELLTAMDSIGQPVCCKDLDHVITQANQSFHGLFSGERRELAGLTDYDLFPEDYADKSWAAEEQVLAGEADSRLVVQVSEEPRQKQSFENRTVPIHVLGKTVGFYSIVTDVAGRSLTERTWREESAQEAYRLAELGTFVVDLSARTWTASDLVYEILGLAKDCARTAAIWGNLISEEDHGRLCSLFGEVSSGLTKRIDTEVRFVYEGKEFRWVRFRAELEEAAQRNPKTLHGTIKDITAQKRGEEDVKASSSLIEMFIRDAPAGAAMFDRDMQFKSASQRWIDERERGERQIIARHLYDLHPRIPEPWKEDHRRALAGETTPYREERFEDESGIEHWVWRMVQPWREGDGRIGGIVIFSEDITARKQAEGDVREKEESLREAQRIAGLGSYVLEIATGVWTASEMLDGIFGIGAEYPHSFEGWKALLHPDDKEAVESHMVSYLANEASAEAPPFDREYRIVRPSDGVTRWVHGLGRVEFDADGHPRILRGTIQDITRRKAVEATLMESRQLLQLFIERAPTAIAMFDREMRYIAVSQRWIDNYALADQTILGRSHYEVFPDIPEHWKDVHRRGMAGEGQRSEEERFDRSDGSKLWLLWEMIPWRRADGSVGGIILFTEDVSALKASTERLQLAASVFTHASESIVITDSNGAILDANNAFTRITGYTRDEILGKNPRLLNSGRQPREFYADMWTQLKDKGQWSGEIWNRSKSGQIYPGMLTVNAVPDAAGKTKHYVGLFSDLSPVKERERQLKHVAHFDMLTGLPNRTLLADRLRQAMAQAKRMGRLLALAYVDLDDFSAMNERHGRIVGDQLLNALTQRMSTALQEADTLARLGGDEFAAVLLDNGNIEESLAQIGRLREVIGEPVQLGDLNLQTSASIGITFYPQADEVEPDQLLRQADQAMYFAKLAGKGRYHVFDPMLDRSMRGRHEDLQRIRQALHAEEFELYFQPKVNMRTGAVLGAEALIRWRHPELGLLSPQHFLPVMEGNLLVVELGEWVIERALTHMETWRDVGLDIPISVNVDALQLQEPRFVDRLKEILARHPQIEPSKLELEVLESSAFQDLAQVSEVIRACSKLGVSFALDDFGTGYSSLSYLKRLPVDVLKIDQSFVHDMLDDPEDLSILEGVLVLANAFRRLAVAEGVETVDHGLMLLRLGCQIGQGYEIARPMHASDLPGWVAAWRPDSRWMGASAIDPVKWPALRAGVDHRAWVVELEEYIEGRRLAAPANDPHLCRFGQWMDAETSAGRGKEAAFRSVYDVHRELHTQADHMLVRKAENGGAMTAALPQLHALRDDLLAKLQDLAQTL